jgi:hypothetical protein
MKQKGKQKCREGERKKEHGRLSRVLKINEQTNRNQEKCLFSFRTFV